MNTFELGNYAVKITILKNRKLKIIREKLYNGIQNRFIVAFVWYKHFSLGFNLIVFILILTFQNAKIVFCYSGY